MSIGKPLAQALLLLLAGTAPVAAADVALARLDCGAEPQPVSVASFSDTFAWPDLKLALTYSCYLIRHGDRYLLWDTGNALDDAPEAPKVSLLDQLKRLKLSADAIDYVGISHPHLDHTGQLAAFPKATLLIGKGDWDVMSAAQPPAGMDEKSFAERRGRFAPWLSGGAKIETLGKDRKDVFGDGSVMMISLPGHTPGHHGLLVKLKQKGNVLLSGDVTHFHENYDNDGIPTWNTDRAQSLASLDRFKKIAKNVNATVIIQHDPRDVAKLPVFPAFAD